MNTISEIESWKNGMVRYADRRAHDTVDDPRLAADLGRHPTGQDGDQARGPHPHGETQEGLRAVQLGLPPQPQAPEAEREHEKAEADHDAEASRKRPSNSAGPPAEIPSVPGSGRPSCGSGSGCRDVGPRPRSAFSPAAMSGQPNRISGTLSPGLFSQWPSIAAILAGWYSSVLRPC